MLVAPNGKRYIGQVYSWTGDGKRRKGSEQRWKEHVYAAVRGSQLILSRAIRKYGSASFKLVTLTICPKRCLDYYEVKYIRQYNTLSPGGYNMTEGGQLNKFSYEVRLKLQAAARGEKNLFWGKHFTTEQKAKMLQTLSLKPRRGNQKGLPMYVFYYRKTYRGKSKTSIKEGYEVTNHPSLKTKLFCGSKFTLSEKLRMALAYLKS